MINPKSMKEDTNMKRHEFLLKKGNEYQQKK